MKVHPTGVRTAAANASFLVIPKKQKAIDNSTAIGKAPRPPASDVPSHIIYIEGIVD